MSSLHATTISQMVSLSVMLLLMVALVAGQADATLHDTAHAGSGVRHADTLPDHAAIRVTPSAVDLPDLSITVEVDTGVAQRAATLASDAFRDLVGLR